MAGYTVLETMQYYDRQEIHKLAYRSQNNFGYPLVYNSFVEEIKFMTRLWERDYERQMIVLANYLGIPYDSDNNNS